MLSQKGGRHLEQIEARFEDYQHMAYISNCNQQMMFNAISMRIDQPPDRMEEIERCSDSNHAER